jgi:hypothetical protein
MRLTFGRVALMTLVLASAGCDKMDLRVETLAPVLFGIRHEALLASRLCENDRCLQGVLRHGG